MIKDKNIDPSAYSPNFFVSLHTCGALSNGVANTTVQDSWVAPFSGKIVSAQTFCTAVVATGTVDLFKGSSSVLSGAQAPVASTSTDITAAVTTVAFSAGDTLSLRCVTTGGSGAITKPTIMLTVRPLCGKEVFGY